MPSNSATRSKKRNELTETCLVHCRSYLKKCFFLSFRKGMRSGTRWCNVATEPALYKQQKRPVPEEKRNRSAQHPVHSDRQSEIDEQMHKYRQSASQTNRDRYIQRDSHSLPANLGSSQVNGVGSTLSVAGASMTC